MIENEIRFPLKSAKYAQHLRLHWTDQNQEPKIDHLFCWNRRRRNCWSWWFRINIYVVLQEHSTKIITINPNTGTTTWPQNAAAKRDNMAIKGEKKNEKY